MSYYLCGMEKSVLYQVLQSLSPTERNAFRKFLESPYFNQRKDLIELYTLMIVSSPVPDKVEIWKKISGSSLYDEQKLRLLMSYLLQLTERFLVIKALEDNPLQQDLMLASTYRKRGMPEAFERTRKELERKLEKQPLRDLDYYEWSQQLQWEHFQQVYVNQPTEIELLHLISELSDISYYIRKMRLICLMTAHQSVYPNVRNEYKDIPAFIERLAQLSWKSHPALEVYLLCYRMLHEPDENRHFHAFKNALFDHAARFSKEEMHGLYIWAINHCVRSLNAGKSEYVDEVLELYKEGLRKEYLLENGILSRFTYHNIVAAGLQTQDLEWVRFFINEYKNKLEKKYRESAFSFNLARLEYASKRYDYVLELLQKANYRDPLRNLAAKTLLLKTFFETKEFDTLQSHLDAMRNYIHRKRVLGYHRTNYLNIIKYTEKLIQTDPYNRKALQKLRQEVTEEKVLTEKNYFLQWIQAELKI